MKARKKLLIALLSATCLTAGAFGLAACKDKPNEKPTEEPDDAAYTVVAKDDQGNPVEGVWFCIGYMDGYNFVNVKNDGSTNLAAQSGADGKAKFNFEPEDGKTYQVRLAELQEGRNVPFGYNSTQYSADFTQSSTSVEFIFNYVPNHFNYNQRTELNYKRVYDAATGTAKEVKSESKFTLEKNRHVYFYLNTYQEPSGEITAEQATVAAAGVYEVSYATTETSVKMYKITSTHIPSSNTSGIPDGSDSPATTVELERTVYGGISRRADYFGVYADKDCEVTINVTRKRDAVEPDELQTRKANLTAPTAKCAEGVGTLTLMPTDGTMSALKGQDGYYHVGSATGPTLYATLTRAIPSRVAEVALKDLPNLDIDGGKNVNVFILPERNSNNQVTGYVDYTDVVAEYSKWVNNGGVYPVNDDLYAFLQAYGGQCYGAVPGRQNWLLPCQFYVPEGGIDVTGSGTEYDPFILAETENRIDLTSFTGEKAYLSFTANNSGAYSFTPSNGTVLTQNGSTLNGKYYVAAMLGDTIELELTPGADKVISLMVAVESDQLTGDVKFIEAEQGGMDPTDPNKVIDGKGISEDTAINILFGVSAYVVDSYTNAEGVWVKFSPFGDATYNVTVTGENAKLVYNGQPYTSGQTLTLQCSVGSTYKFLLSTTKAFSGNESQLDVNLLCITLVD